MRISMWSKTGNGPADISKTFISFCQLKAIHVIFKESWLGSLCHSSSRVWIPCLISSFVRQMNQQSLSSTASWLSLRVGAFFPSSGLATPFHPQLPGWCNRTDKINTKMKQNPRPFNFILCLLSVCVLVYFLPAERYYPGNNPGSTTTPNLVHHPSSAGPTKLMGRWLATTETETWLFLSRMLLLCNQSRHTEDRKIRNLHELACSIWPLGTWCNARLSMYSPWFCSVLLLVMIAPVPSDFFRKELMS